jgi:glutathione peroxidase
MAAYDHDIHALDGKGDLLGPLHGQTTLMVNVASKCGLTPQYTALQQLQDKYADRGFSVVGFPCNQFMGQEPGTPEEIATFCSTTYGVTFPLSEKIEVNGDGRHELYRALVEVPDSDDGHTGDIRWNFEKFLLAPGGKVVGRFAPTVDPESTELVDAIESALPR